MNATRPASQPYPAAPLRERPPRRRHPVLFALSMISLILVVATVGAAVAASAPSAAHRHGKVWHMRHEHISAQPVDTQPADTQPAAPQYSVAQQQAIESAESYLRNEGGFSRLGLISQLDSKYGEGFSKKLAVFAVTHIRVNWYRQAVISAESYMKNEPGWSYSGLVDQLHSRYGEQFTLAQAKYAAKAVGL